jgi:hypothetical protein
MKISSWTQVIPAWFSLSLNPTYPPIMTLKLIPDSSPNSLANPIHKHALGRANNSSRSEHSKPNWFMSKFISLLNEILKARVTKPVLVGY